MPTASPPLFYDNSAPSRIPSRFDQSLFDWALVVEEPAPGAPLSLRLMRWDEARLLPPERAHPIVSRNTEQYLIDGHILARVPHTKLPPSPPAQQRACDAAPMVYLPYPDFAVALAELGCFSFNPSREPPRARIAVLDKSFDDATPFSDINPQAPEIEIHSLEETHPIAPGFREVRARIAETIVRYLRGEAPPGALPQLILEAHGDLVAHIAGQVAPSAEILRLHIDRRANKAMPAYIAVALARAAAWKADVVILALNDLESGCPPWLKTISRWAADQGLVLCHSVGRLDNNGYQKALSLDELASQPWVFSVAACNGRGIWRGADKNRYGPAVAITAPGSKFSLQYDPAQAAVHVYDSSLATALAGGVMALVRARNRSLTVAELRALLAVTAERPGVTEPVAHQGAVLRQDPVGHWEDPQPARSGSPFPYRDICGHNFRLGHGRMNALNAWLTAGDPVCYALLAVRECPEPPRTTSDLRIAIAIKDRPLAARMAFYWNEKVDQMSHPLAERYRALRGALVRLLIQSIALQQVIYLLARHLLALYGDGRANRWFQEVRDHDALTDDLRYALGTAETELFRLNDSTIVDNIGSWLRDLAAAIVKNGSLAVTNLLQGIFVEALAADRRG